MKNKIALGTLSLIASALLVGCGSSSTITSTDTTTDTSTGYFVDAPVAGAKYRTSSGLEGVTASDGSFKCELPLAKELEAS